MTSADRREPGDMLVVRAGRVFDGVRTIEPPTVLIGGDAVVDVGVDTPPGATVVEFADATLVPGLVDCHQHLCFDGDGTLEEQVADVDDDGLRVRARESARRALLGRCHHVARPRRSRFRDAVVAR